MEKQIELLRQKLAKTDTYDILEAITLKLITYGNDEYEVAYNSNLKNKTKLLSPRKQWKYLIGLLLSTKQIKNKHDYQLKDLEDDIAKITNNYNKEFVKDIISLDETKFTDEDRDKGKRDLIAMEAFTSYFDVDTLRYPQQTEKIIRNIFQPFNDYIKTKCGLSVEDMLDFNSLMIDELRKSYETETLSEKRMKSLIDRISNASGDSTTEKFNNLMSMAASNNMKIRELFNQMQAEYRKKGLINHKIIYTRYGHDKGKKLLDLFTTKRNISEFRYYSDRNIIDYKPLVYITNNEFFMFPHDFLINAIYNYLESIFNSIEMPNFDKYVKLKGNITEKMFLDLFEDIFGNEAVFHQSVCEKPGTDEHDIIIEYKDYVFIVEVKSTKIREPFRNPKKGYTRVKDDFYKKGGIGYAYQNQAIKLKKYMEKSNSVLLFENKTSKFIINDLNKKTIIPIVLTLHQYGSIAINTSLLIEPEEGQPYPWVCNWHDFDDIVKIMKYKKLSKDDFIEYVCFRVENHKKIISNDEIDIYENFVFDKEKLYESIKHDYLMVDISPNNLIDKIYFEENGIPMYVSETVEVDNYDREKSKDILQNIIET